MPASCSQELSNFQVGGMQDYIILICHVVILRFIGQLLASALLDDICLDIFSKGKVMGGVLFLLGLIKNSKADNTYKKEKAEPCENM